MEFLHMSLILYRLNKCNERTEYTKKYITEFISLFSYLIFFLIRSSRSLQYLLFDFIQHEYSSILKTKL